MTLPGPAQLPIRGMLDDKRSGDKCKTRDRGTMQKRCTRRPRRRPRQHALVWRRTCRSNRTQPSKGRCDELAVPDDCRVPVLTIPAVREGRLSRERSRLPDLCVQTSGGQRGRSGAFRAAAASEWSKLIMLCQRARVEAAFGAVQRGVGPTAQRRRGHLSRAELDDWRSFRAALVFDQTSWKRGDPNAANLDLLRRQSPALAAEETWCHPTGLAEVGGLLLATPRCQDILQDEKLWQIVVLIVSLGEQGAVGLTLNRPTDLNMGVRTRGAFPMDVGGLSNQHRRVTGALTVTALLSHGTALRPRTAALRRAHLGACRIYSGGPTAQQRLQVLHRHGWLGEWRITCGVEVQSSWQRAEISPFPARQRGPWSSSGASTPGGRRPLLRLSLRGKPAPLISGSSPASSPGPATAWGARSPRARG